MTIIEWLDSLCPRLQHIIQVELGTHFDYDLNLANAATENSKRMLEGGGIGHIHPLYFPCLAEVVAYSNVNNNDENALYNITNAWKFSKECHREDLLFHNNIGIGFAYSRERDILYASARLG